MQIQCLKINLTLENFFEFYSVQETSCKQMDLLALLATA